MPWLAPIIFAIFLWLLFANVLGKFFSNRLACKSAKWWQRNAFDRMLATTYTHGESGDPDSDFKLSAMLSAFMNNNLKSININLCF